MTTAQNHDLSLIGETVTISYVADPILGRGEFRLENHGTDPATLSIAEAWLELGAERETLERATLFDRTRGEMIDPASFTIGAGETIPLILGFPQRMYEPRFGESTAVGLRLRGESVELEASSPIKFVRRIPRRNDE